VKTVLLCSTTTGYQIRSFGDAAEKLGVRVVFASDRCDQLEDPWWDHAIPVRFHEEARSVGTVVRALQVPPVTRLDGVLAVGDRPTILAAQVAEAMGVPGNPPDAARASRNKLEARTAFEAAGLPTTAFQAVSVDRDPHELARAAPYPAVLKPLALSGSRGVIRVNGPDEFIVAFERLRAILGAPDVRAERDALHGYALVEAFIPGREFAVEGLLDRGVFMPLAIFDKPDPLDGPFFEESIYVTPSRASTIEQRAIVDAVRRAAAALGLRHGPVHAECRVAPLGDRAPESPRVYVLEVAARPIGGLCARALRVADDSGSEASLEEVLLRHAVGEDVSGYSREPAASGVMMIPIPARGVYRRVDGVDEARRVPDVEDVRITAKPDTVLIPPPEGRSYLGFIFARGASPERVERALRAAHARLRFVIETALPVNQ
jgi:biotin carboxylase